MSRHVDKVKVEIVDRDACKMKDFQSQFLRFSRSQEHQADGFGSESSAVKAHPAVDENLDDKADVGHIAALLQVCFWIGLVCSVSSVCCTCTCYGLYNNAPVS